jgi:hypothetical protein
VTCNDQSPTEFAKTNNLFSGSEAIARAEWPLRELEQNHDHVMEKIWLDDASGFYRNRLWILSRWVETCPPKA